MDRESLHARGIPAESLIPGSTVVDEKAIADALSRARWVMVY